MKAPVRVKLMLWYAAALAVVLVSYATAVSLFLRQRLSAELDRSLHEDVERSEERLESTDDGRLVWRGRHPSEDYEEDWASGQWLEIWQGTTLLLRGPGAPLPELGTPDPAASGPGRPRSLLLQSGLPVRLLDGRIRIGSVPVVVRAVRSEQRLRHEVAELTWAHVFAIPLAVVLSALGGYHLARRLLSPVATMTERARRITAESLSERLPVENPRDELGQLATAFNDTFARLERSFDQLRRFTADASHELRTPLTVIRSVGEVGLDGHPGEQAYRDTLGSILEEADRLTTLVDTLLTLSRADAGEASLSFEVINLVALAREVAADLLVLAEEKAQTLTVEGAIDVLVRADRVVLQQALVNLVGNAIKYSPPGSPVRMVLSQDDAGGVEIAVVDRGPGIASDLHERIFDRFFRVDTGRSREKGGAGLGLSLAKWGIEAHGGSIRVESQPGEGSTFRVTLPRAETESGG